MKPVMRGTVKPDGHATYFHVFLETSMIPDQDKTKEQLMAELAELRQQVTLSRQAEQSLQDSEHRFSTLTRTTSDAVLITDGSGIIIFCNTAAEKIFGYTAEELHGKSSEMLRPEQFRTADSSNREAFMRTGSSPFIGETITGKALKKDGSEFYAEVATSYWKENDRVFFCGIVRDITERKAVEAALRESEAQYSELVAARTAEIIALNVQLQREIEEHEKSVEALRRSEEQFRSVIENASDAIVTADSSGNIVLWNKAAEDIYGYTAGEMLNKPFIQIMPEQQQEFHWQQFTTFLAERKPGVIVTHGELNARRKDGSEFPAEGSASLWETREGVFITSLVRDISERKRAETLLKESEERFRNLAQTATDAIFVADESRRIVFWNKAAETIFGYTAEEVLDKQSTLVVPDEQRAQDEAGYQTVVAAGSSPLMGHVFESFGRRKDGTTFSTEVSLSRWLMSNKIFFCVIARDITQRKAIETALRESEEKFRTMTENITASIFIYQDHDLVYVNPAAVKT